MCYLKGMHPKSSVGKSRPRPPTCKRAPKYTTRSVSGNLAHIEHKRGITGVVPANHDVAIMQNKSLLSKFPTQKVQVLQSFDWHKSSVYAYILAWSRLKSKYELCCGNLTNQPIKENSPICRKCWQRRAKRAAILKELEWRTSWWTD